MSTWWNKNIYFLKFELDHRLGFFFFGFLKIKKNIQCVLWCYLCPSIERYKAPHSVCGSQWAASVALTVPPTARMGRADPRVWTRHRGVLNQPLYVPSFGFTGHQVPNLFTEELFYCLKEEEYQYQLTCTTWQHTIIILHLGFYLLLFLCTAWKVSK